MCGAQVHKWKGTRRYFDFRLAETAADEKPEEP
jgi:hypothetical protein